MKERKKTLLMMEEDYIQTLPCNSCLGNCIEGCNPNCAADCKKKGFSRGDCDFDPELCCCVA
jgi:hypothetical protein